MSPIHWAQPKICVTHLFPSAPVHPAALGIDTAYSLFGPGVSSAPTWLEQVTCGQHLDILLAPQQAHLRLSLKGPACCLRQDKWGIYVTCSNCWAALSRQAIYPF